MEPLKTLRGSHIWYAKGGIGKKVGSKIYLHKDYALDVVPTDVWWDAQDILHKYEPGATFNCICYDLKKPSVVRFDEASHFDRDREPYPGIMWTVDTSKASEGEKCYKVGYSDMVWHHKWLWVTEDYDGFDVSESYAWSKLWLSKVNEVASGSLVKWKKTTQKSWVSIRRK